MKKIFVFSIIAVVVILFLTTSVLRLIFGPDGQIPDENGESKELCHFSDEDIEACYADYRIIGRSVQSKGMGDSHVKGRLEEFDCSYSCTSFGKFSGIYILNAYLADGESVAYTIDSEVLEGNLRIVITDEENQILRPSLPSHIANSIATTWQAFSLCLSYRDLIYAHISSVLCPSNPRDFAS